MNGIDGLSGKIPVALDARMMSSAAKHSDVEGTNTGSQTAAAFGDHLADLSRQNGKPTDSTGLASSPNRAPPARVQQNVRLAAGTATAASHGASELEMGVPEGRSESANPQASDAKAAKRFAPGHGGLPATMRDSAPAAVNPDVPNETPAEGATAFGAGAPVLDGEISPVKRLPVTIVSREPRAGFVPGGAASFLISPVTLGLPLQGTPGALNQAKAADSKETAAALAEASLAGMASVSDAMREMVLLGPSASASNALRVAGQPPPIPVLGSRGKPVESKIVEPHASVATGSIGDRGPEFAASAPAGIVVINRQTHLAPPNGLLPAQQMPRPRAAPAPARAPLDSRGHAAPVEMAPRAEESAQDSAAAKDLVKPSAILPADQNGGHGLNSAAPMPVRGLVGSQPAHTVAPGSRPPAQQIVEWIAAAASPENGDASAATVQTNFAFDAAPMADSRLFTSRVQTMQLQLDPGDLGKVTVSLRLLGTRLDLRVETERPEAMQLIGKDKDLLTSKLQAAGYSVENLIIQPAAPQASHQQFGVNAQPNGQDHQTGQHANGDPSAHDRPSTNGDGQQPRRPSPDDAQDGAGVRHSGSDLYI